MHCDPKWEQPQDITLAGMFFIIGRALGDLSSSKAINQLLQKTKPEHQQQMVIAPRDTASSSFSETYLTV
jgi:hypothetical protein